MKRVAGPVTPTERKDDLRRDYAHSDWRGNQRRLINGSRVEDRKWAGPCNNIGAGSDDASHGAPSRGEAGEEQEDSGEVHRQDQQGPSRGSRRRRIRRRNGGGNAHERRRYRRLAGNRRRLRDVGIDGRSRHRSWNPHRQIRHAVRKDRHEQHGAHYARPNRMPHGVGAYPRERQRQPRRERGDADPQGRFQKDAENRIHLRDLTSRARR